MNKTKGLENNLFSANHPEVISSREVDLSGELEELDNEMAKVNENYYKMQKSVIKNSYNIWIR